MFVCSALLLGFDPDGCAVMASEGALTTPVELQERSEANAAPQSVELLEGEPVGAQTAAGEVVPEYWAPEAEPVLPGLDGAAQLLAAGRLHDALDQLPHAVAEQGSAAWFRHHAIAGRAHRLLGNYRASIAALEPVLVHDDVEDHLPIEIVEYELARSRIALGRRGGLPRGEADAMLDAAADDMARAVRRKPNRQVLPMRVAYLEALFGIEGTDDKSRKRAARKAIKAADRLIVALPNHPDVGYWHLDKARAQVRGGDPQGAAATLRELMITRAGEPEAASAWVDLVALAEREPKVDDPELSTSEQLRRAYHARDLRRVEVSRAILDDLLADEELPSYRRREALHSRAWTAYKQRDFNTCIEDARTLYDGAHTGDYRDLLVRCLERGERYDEAIELWLDIANDKSAGRFRRPAALWTALELAINGGLYETAGQLLAQYEKDYNGHISERRKLRAWLAYRNGDRDAAIAGFESLEKSSASDRTMAKYFRGKLLVRSKNEKARESGASLLKEIIKADPLDYYGLQARQRMLDAGFNPGPQPKLAPVPDENERPTWEERQVIYTGLVEEFAGASSAIERGAQLHAIGWMDEARRELRYVSDEYENTERRMRGVDVRVPRSESLEVGLSWKPEWDYPKPTFGRDGRAVMRDDEASVRLRDGLRALAAGLDEPYRWIRLTDYQMADYKARWHPRAYRSYLEKYAAAQKIDPTHLWGLMYTESRFRRYVVSYVGARGALQIMPWTCRQLMEMTGEFGGHLDPDILYDIDTNSRLAALYISELLRKFQGQGPLAYASYNGGPSNVARWVRAKSRDNALEMDDFVEEIPFDESQRYARRVMEVTAAYELLYGEGLPRWKNDVDPKIEDNIDF